MSKNIVWHQASISKEDRRQKNNHHSCILWFTGLSASGKSTIANEIAKALYHLNVQQYVLDGDNIRHGLNKDLGFTDFDRTENIRRIGEVAKLFVDNGQIVLTAFISPFIADRNIVRSLVEQDEFIEVYVECPVETCESRDPKGLYKKAKNGEIQNFTGISSPYEAPINPEITLNTDKQSVQECVETILQFLKSKNYIG
ncbi:MULTISPECIES: adenylyl-sulfate kinase [Bacillaceae]|uniref:adenylyl-sulfate kinase n=1 Tax=Bacillaceae TaxID=186817 RepID=UPI000BEB5592|nr:MULTISPECIES: adenylyl-sulfate kinase [unclassified Bacillus (in: firmicutes)]PEC47901.1 adenylyl-sulfate kinase [Bacillus sp. AFS096315]PFM80138.1 adenylyl-sulfate kinase [Bacillus sp. AFS077874]